VVLHAQSDDLAIFEIYRSDGSPADWSELVETSEKAEVVLFGELHDHALIHWLQFRLAKELSKDGDLILGAEFFETDNQAILDEYLMGLTPDKKLEAEAKLWPNYKTDYAPILQLARDSALVFVATNIPRRFASFVARHGLDTLQHFPEASKAFMPKLPVPFSMEVPGYEEMISMMGGGHGMQMNPENFVKAQALKDYTMAQQILAHGEQGKTFLHINGDFHSADYGGIYWYLKNAKPKLEILTIKIETFQNDPAFQQDWENGGDFILVVPEDFTRTH
jgi:uncharacterized iron-regulated protein